MFRILRQKCLRELLLALALLLATAALVAAPGEAIAGAKDGLMLCGNVIIPSLFPFFVLSSLVVDLGFATWLGRLLEPVMRPLFRVSGSCAAAVAMGFIGGYPVGARTAIQLYERGLCTKTEAERLLSFCNNSGPAFILGVVGAGVFGSGKIGLLLYLTHAAASFLVGLLFRFYGGSTESGREGKTRAVIETVRASSAFTGAVGKALRSTLNICAFVVFFSVILKLLSVYGILSGFAGLLGLFGIGDEWARRLVAGLLELTSGVSSLTGSGTQGVSMAAFMLGWAGLSVHCQVLSFIGESGLSVRAYISGKLCHGFLAAALTWVITSFFPLAEPVSVYLSEQAESIAGLDFSSSLGISLASVFGVWVLWVLLCGVIVKKSGGKISFGHV